MGTVRYTNANGMVLAEMRNGVRRAYAHDPLGSTAALVDNTGAVTDTFEYWPYGEERTRTGSTPTPFRFVGALGYYRDSATRTYVRARHYRQDHGRWTSIDPLWPDESAYGYSLNEPLNNTDPTGKEPFWKRWWDWFQDRRKPDLLSRNRNIKPGKVIGIGLGTIGTGVMCYKIYHCASCISRARNLIRMCNKNCHDLEWMEEHYPQAGYNSLKCQQLCENDARADKSDPTSAECIRKCASAWQAQF